MSLRSFGHSLRVVGFIRNLWVIWACPGCRRVHSSPPCASSVGRMVYSDSFGRALGVVRFIRVRWVRSGVPLGSSGSFGFVWTCPWGCPVHSGSLGHTLGVVEFIRVPWVQSDTPWGSSGSFVFISLIQARPGDRWVHSGLLSSFESALGVVGKIGVRWVR